jgi:tetratricopeptide (TPR) repeat protein
MVQSKKVITLIVLTVGMQCLNGQSRWSAILGDGVNVMSDAGAASVTRMAHRVIQMRQLLGGGKIVLPLRVLLVSSESLFSELRPSATVDGFYQSSADEDWIVVRWGRPESERAVSHELVHAFLEHSGPRRPLWLEEGLAEFYSTASLDARGWTIGRPIESHVKALLQRAWLGEREFFEARHDSALREEGARIGQFYAQSWAVVHYLLTAPGIRERSPALFAALADGVPFGRASEATLGLRPGLLLEAARRAVEQGRFATAKIAAEAPVEAPVEPTPLSREDAEAVLVGVALASGRPAVAARWARSPAQKGLLALRAGDREAAEKQLAEAVANGTPDAAVYFELAMLLREDKRQPERVDALLRQTLERNPNHAEAHSIRGLRAAAAGDIEGAVESYQRAAQILPRQANFWHALALALERTGRLGEASHAAMRCRLAARNAAEREMAAGVERLIREPAMPAAGKKPAVEVPQSWQGLRGDAAAEGELVRFDCTSTPPAARVETPAGVLTLRVERPDSIGIRGTGSVRHTFACGDQRTRVRVEYLRETLELTAIEFR